MLEVDVELQRDASLRGVVGSVRRSDGSLLAVAILDGQWRQAGQGEMVPEDSSVAKLAAQMAVEEAGGEIPASHNVSVKERDHYLVTAHDITRAADQLG